MSCTGALRKPVSVPRPQASEPRGQEGPCPKLAAGTWTHAQPAGSRQLSLPQSVSLSPQWTFPLDLLLGVGGFLSVPRKPEEGTAWKR